MQDRAVLVLEILKQPDALKMSIFEQRDLASTLRHYSSLNVNFSEINTLSEEILSYLARAEKTGNLEAQELKALKKSGSLLWGHLFTHPVKEKLRSTDGTGLILSLDEELIHIPWELVFTGEDFLCLRFNLGRVVRTREQGSSPRYRSFSASLKMLILANPTGDLKSSYEEGLAIRNQFERIRNRVRIDFKSTAIDKLYVKKNLRDYDLVHFAGHCEYDPLDPANSGWVLTDGRFSAGDISALSEGLSLPSIIFSNACTSAGLNREAGAYSLAAAFLFSGVRHYIGSIRKVNDSVSLTLAREFYAQLISGREVGESLRLARLKVIKEHGQGAVDWASYLLYGDPGFSLIRKEFREEAKKFSLNKRWLAGAFLAIALLLVSLALSSWLPSVNPSAYFLFRRSEKLFRKGMNQEVVNLTQEIIRGNPQFLRAYPLLAETYKRQGNRQEALQAYFRYAQLAEKLKDTRSLCDAYIRLGWLYHSSGEYDKAADFYKRALELATQNNDKLHEAAALRRLAVWHMDKEDYTQALQLLTKSSAINSRYAANPEHKYNLACDYFDIAMVLVDRNDYAGAEEFYHKSRRLFEQLKLKNELSDCYFNLGEICLFQKQYRMALECYLKGLKIDEAQGNRPSIAADFNMLGELYVAMDNLREAEDYFNRSLNLAKEIKALPEQAAAYYSLGSLYRKEGKKNLAREYLREAQAIYATFGTGDYERVKKEILELD